MKDKNIIIMAVYNKIENDARVLRSAEMLSTFGKNIKLLSCNSDINYVSKYFESIVFVNNKKNRYIYFIKYLIFVLRYIFLHRKNTHLLYLHDIQMIIIGFVYSFFFKINWVYDAHEIYFQRKNYKCTRLDTLCLFLERISIKKAKLVIEANAERERIVRNIYHLKKTTYIQNVIKEYPLISNVVKEDLIVYQGSMSEERRITRYIKALQYLPQNISIKLIGGGPDLEYYKHFVQKLNLYDRVNFTGRIPYSDMNEQCCMAKLGVVSYLMDNLNHYYCASNKIFEYASMRVPMLFTPQPFLKKIVKKYQIGEVLLESASVIELANLIESMILNYKKYIIGMEDLLNDYTFDNEYIRFKENISFLF
jgi:glycosyltransferase involved in cell wall biosynthesis